MGSSTNNKRLIWIAASLVAFVTLIVYLPALQNEFVNWDDDTLVYENPTLRSIDIPFIGWALTDVSTGLWHPMLWLSFAFDYTAWGLDPFGYHLTNIFFHSLNTFLVFILATRLFLAGGCSLDKKTLTAVTVTALLFGIHPLHVESVAWVTEKKDVLYSFFFLLSLIAYLKYASSYLKRYYSLSLIFFAFSLMSKPMAVSLPMILLILDFYPLKRLANKGRLHKTALVFAEKIPFFILSLLLIVITIWIHPTAGRVDIQEMYPFQGRIFVVVYLYIYYFFKMALPFNLAPIYPIISISETFYIVPFIGLTAIFLLSIWSLKKNTLFFAIWLYYMVTLIPVLGQVGAQLKADRYTYLPSLGPFLLLGVGMGYLSERCSKKQKAALAAVLIFMLGALISKTQTQISVWKDSVTLWSYEIKLFSDIDTAYYNRGNVYGAIGDYQRAIKDFDKAIDINPRYTEAYNLRGSAYVNEGNYLQAIKDFDMAIQLDPGLSKAYFNRGTTYRALKNNHQAISDFSMAISLNPRHAKAYNNRGNAYRELGKYQEAIEDYNMAIKLNPQDAIAYRNRGIVYRNLGDHEQALKDNKKADELGIVKQSNPPPPSSSSGYR